MVASLARVSKPRFSTLIDFSLGILLDSEVAESHPGPGKAQDTDAPATGSGCLARRDVLNNKL